MIVSPARGYVLSYGARSSSGLGRRPFKPEITGSNPVRATTRFLPKAFSLPFGAARDRAQSPPRDVALRLEACHPKDREGGVVSEVEPDQATAEEDFAPGQEGFERVHLA